MAEKKMKMHRKYGFKHVIYRLWNRTPFAADVPLPYRKYGGKERRPTSDGIQTLALKTVNPFRSTTTRLVLMNELLATYTNAMQTS